MNLDLLNIGLEFRKFKNNIIIEILEQKTLLN